MVLGVEGGGDGYHDGCPSGVQRQAKVKPMVPKGRERADWDPLVLLPAASREQQSDRRLVVEQVQETLTLEVLPELAPPVPN